MPKAPTPTSSDLYSEPASPALQSEPELPQWLTETPSAEFKLQMDQGGIDIETCQEIVLSSDEFLKLKVYRAGITNRAGKQSARTAPGHPKRRARA